jgi:MFS family permease
MVVKPVPKSAAYNKPVIAVLIFSTFVFAINTFYIIPIFLLIAEEFNKDISLLGLINATLFIGIGLFQIPAGIIAARYSPRIVSILGMAIIAISSFLVSISSDVNQIALFRFVTGAGLAFFFPSAIVLIAQNFPKERGGLAVGFW